MKKPVNTTDALKQTVFIVDDDFSIGEGLCNLLESVHLPAEHFPSAESFLMYWVAGPAAGRAGCLVLDVQLPGMTGVEFQEKLQKSGVIIPIIFMTAHGDVPMVRKVMKAGAIEFLTKPFQMTELLEAIQQAFAYDRTRREEEGAQDSLRLRFETLTTRERQVMAMVTEGLLNKQTAAELQLSEVTVKLHRRHVMEKMQAASLADLVRMAGVLHLSSYTKA